MGQSRSAWAKPVARGPNQKRMGQTRSAWAKPEAHGPNQKRVGQTRSAWANLEAHGPTLEIQLQPELELPRVECCRWPAVVTTVAGAQVEAVDVGDEGRRGGFVEPIEEIESFRDQLQPEVLTKRDQLRETHVERNVTMRQAVVARQAPAGKLSVRNQRYAAGGPGHTQRSAIQH